MHRVYSFKQWKEGCITNVEKVIAEEYPLTLVLGRMELATVVCTPVDLEYFIYGFLAAEGWIRTVEDIGSIHMDDLSGRVHIERRDGYSPSVSERLENTHRFWGSCCGKGRQSIYFKNDLKTIKHISYDASFTDQVIVSSIRQFETMTRRLSSSGALHHGAFVKDGVFIYMTSDIGRHNVLDKLYGYWLKHPFSLQDVAIVFSGRVSSEIALKVAKIGVSLLISNAAPTDLGLRIADELGVTVVGFARDNQFNIYTHSGRVCEEKRPVYVEEDLTKRMSTLVQSGAKNNAKYESLGGEAPGF